MSRIQFTKSVDALLRGAGSLALVASEKALRDGTVLRRLPAELRRVAAELVGDARAGEVGAGASSLSGVPAPRRLALAVLPDRVSRHNAPSRAEAARRTLAGLNLGERSDAGSAVWFGLDDPEHYLPLANALGRALPLYSRKTGSSKAPNGVPKGDVKVLAVGRDGEPVAPSARLKAVVGEAREVARLVDTPPSELHPAAFQAAAWKAVVGLTGVTKKALVGGELLRAGLGGIHAVGRSALEAPRMLLLSLPGGHGRGRKHVALVGKGITFDTGGLSLKVGGGMFGMKADMGGAAAVLGAFCALARVGCPHRLSAVLCIAENAIGPSSYKVDDVLTLHSGKTVEINNTDAEGRLLLADGVSYAARVLKADVVIDAATLTGAQLVATGKRHAAVVSNEASLEAALVAAGTRSGDLVHPLIFAPELYKEEFKSNVADMRNSVGDRNNAQSSCAAQFVHWHVEDTGVTWGHVDMAGPAFVDRRATGFGVALLEEVVRGL